MRGDDAGSGRTLKPTEPTGFVYLDTNIVSYLARGDLPNFVPNILDAGAIPIVSDVVLQEVKRGSDSSEVEFIEQNGLLFASAHEALFIGDRRTFYTVPIEIDSEDSEFIEGFLRKFVRSICGNNSVGDLASLLLTAAHAVLDDVAEGLPPETDPRILAAWDNANEVLSKKFKELESLPEPTLLNVELQDVQRLASVIGSLKPPLIFDQVVGMRDFAGVNFLAEMCRPFAPDENMKERIQLLCLTLVCLGFARDKRLPNDSDIKSEAGARSQFSDAYHIAAAATCTVFVTADARCAKLAYAVYEALNFKTDVCFVRPRNVEKVFSLVGKDFWP